MASAAEGLAWGFTTCFRTRPKSLPVPSRDGRRVLLIRGAALGLIPYWPTADKLAAHLISQGFAATVINHYEYRQTARTIASEVRRGYWQGGVSLAGYSFGADFACLLASRLETLEIPVSACVLIESTFGIPVPRNVEHSINYYKTRPLDFLPTSRGIRVDALGTQTDHTNVNVRDVVQLTGLSQCNHFTIGDHPQMHEKVTEFLLTRKPPAFIRQNSDSEAKAKVLTIENRVTRLAS
jgi:hypothetical protein